MYVCICMYIYIYIWLIHPVRIAIIHYPIFVPMVGLGFKEIRTLSALMISKGWVRKDPNLGLLTGCTRQTFIHIHQSTFAASNSKQVYRILSNWCLWATLSCGMGLPVLARLISTRFPPTGCRLIRRDGHLSRNTSRSLGLRLSRPSPILRGKPKREGKPPGHLSQATFSRGHAARPHPQ